jgi:hypothetical protein
LERSQVISNLILKKDFSKWFFYFLLLLNNNIII